MVDSSTAYNDVSVFIALLGLLVPIVLAYWASRQVEDIRSLLSRLVKKLSA